MGLVEMRKRWQDFHLEKSTASCKWYVLSFTTFLPCDFSMLHFWLLHLGIESLLGCIENSKYNLSGGLDES